MQNLDVSSATALCDVGTIIDDNAGRRFQYVYCSPGGTAQYYGSPAAWQASTVDYVVVADLSDTAAAATGATGGPAGGAAGFAGLFCLNNSSTTTGCYLWIQIKGLMDGACVSTDVAAEDELLISADDVLVDVQSYASSLTDVYCRVVGIALTAAAAHGTATGDQTTHSTASVILY